jgi:hypothetical protein
MNGRVFPGQSFGISAPHHNRMVDAADAHAFAGRRGQAGMRIGPQFDGTVLVKNVSGNDVGWDGVLGISGLLFSREANESQFKARRLCFEGDTPSMDHVGRFLITAEPIGNGNIGRAFKTGVVVVPVRMVSEDHQYAEVDDGQNDRLVSGLSGALQLLWIEPIVERDVANIAWCVGMLGGGGGGQMTVTFAMITAKAGSLPPYRYAASQATMDADGNWAELVDGAAYDNLFNIEEQGAGGQWVNPLLVGDVVIVYPAPDPSVDAFVCSRAHYRGTF